LGYTGVNPWYKNLLKIQKNHTRPFRRLEIEKLVPMSLDFDSAQLPNPNLTDLHHAWREQLRRFIDVEIMPFADDWDEAGEIPIGLWPKAAEVGLLGLSYPEAYGGTPGDVWLGQITAEELGRVGAGGINASLMVHNIGLPPIINWGSQTMKDAIAPPILRGEAWISLGITEPGGGSDVANLQTTAVRDGDDYVVNGSKTYITGGMRANWVSTAVRTGGEGAGGVSMLLIPTDAEGFSRTPLNRKQGWWASDTATLYFDNVRVPATQLIGAGKSGFPGDHDEL
jgi:acyl-CoA dehydrogenase